MKDHYPADKVLVQTGRQLSRILVINISLLCWIELRTSRSPSGRGLVTGIGGSSVGPLGGTGCGLTGKAEILLGTDSSL